MSRDKFYLLTLNKKNVVVFPTADDTKKFLNTVHPTAKAINHIKNNSTFLFYPVSIDTNTLEAIVPQTLNCESFGFIDGIELTTEKTRDLILT